MKNAQRTYMDFPKVTWCESSDITLVYQPQSSSYSSILIQIYNVVRTAPAFHTRIHNQHRLNQINRRDYREF